MTWNYRVVNCEDETEGDPWVEIREVFYDTMGKPMGHTTATVGSESLSDIKQVLEWMLLALDKPVLKFTKEPDENINLRL